MDLRLCVFVFIVLELGVNGVRFYRHSDPVRYRGPGLRGENGHVKNDCPVQCRCIALSHLGYRDMAERWLSMRHMHGEENTFKAPTWSQYVECFKSRKLPYECGQHLVKSCTTAKHRVTKVVRMDVVGVSSLLDRNSNLKIVQLVRDPRGIVNSRLHTFWYRKILPTDTSIEQDMKMLCSRLRDDIKTGTYYAQMFSARYKIVQYEDIGDSPDKIMKLYKYLGMEELDRYDTFIQALFDKPKNKSTKSFHPYDTFIKTLFDRSKNKATDGFHPYSYRQELPWHIAEKVQNNCHGVFNELGLRIFSNKSEYEDLSIDVTLGEFPFKIS